MPSEPDEKQSIIMSSYFKTQIIVLPKNKMLNTNISISPKKTNAYIGTLLSQKNKF